MTNNTTLIDILYKKHFNTPIESISYLLDAGYNIDDAITYTNQLFNTNILSDSKSDIAFKKLKVIIKTLNDGWIPDWNNSNQYRYFPYFDMTSEGFSYYATLYHFSYTAVPSALYLKSKELAEYCAKTHINLYKDLYGYTI